MWNYVSHFLSWWLPTCKREKVQSSFKIFDFSNLFPSCMENHACLVNRISTHTLSLSHIHSNFQLLPQISKNMPLCRTLTYKHNLSKSELSKYLNFIWNTFCLCHNCHIYSGPVDRLITSRVKYWSLLRISVKIKACVLWSCGVVCRVIRRPPVLVPPRLKWNLCPCLLPLGGVTSAYSVVEMADWT